MHCIIFLEVIIYFIINTLSSSPCDVRQRIVYVCVCFGVILGGGSFLFSEQLACGNVFGPSDERFGSEHVILYGHFVKDGFCVQWYVCIYLVYFSVVCMCALGVVLLNICRSHTHTNTVMSVCNWFWGGWGALHTGKALCFAAATFSTFASTVKTCPASTGTSRAAVRASARTPWSASRFPGRTTVCRQIE